VAELMMMMQQDLATRSSNTQQEQNHRRLHQNHGASTRTSGSASTMAARGGGKGVPGYAAVAVAVVLAAMLQRAGVDAMTSTQLPTASPMTTNAPIPIPADGTLWSWTMIGMQWYYGDNRNISAFTACVNGDVIYNEWSERTTTFVRGDMGVTFTGTSALHVGGGIVAVPAEGTVVLSDITSNLVMTISMDMWGYETILQSTTGGSGLPGARDGVGTEAAFHSPMGVTLAPPSTLYVADGGGHQIRKLTPYTNDSLGVTINYRVTTPAGTGAAGYADGAGATAKFKNPVSVAASGNDLYIADRDNGVIRRMDMTTTEVTTIAGTGQYGTSGDGGPASQAMLAVPVSVAVDSHGALLFIADTEQVRVVTLATHIINTVVIAGGWNFGRIVAVSAPRANTLYFANASNIFLSVPVGPSPSASVTPSGFPSLAYTPTPASCCAPAAGANSITYDSEIIAGGGSETGSGTTALKYDYASPPLALAALPNYDVWVGSAGSLDVVRDEAVHWETAHHSGDGGSNGDGGPPQGAVVDQVTAVAVTPAGDVWMYDAGPGAFRVIHAATGNITTAAYAAGNMSGMTYANVWGEPSLLVADKDHHVVWQLRMSSSSIEPIVGMYGNSGRSSGPLSGTLLWLPADVAWHAAATTMYVADSGNCGVRRVNMAYSSSPYSWESYEVSNLPPNLVYTSVAVDSMGVLWVACPTSPALVRVIGANTYSPSVVSVFPRPGLRWNGNMAFINVVHPLTNASIDVIGHRVVRAGATDILYTIPVPMPMQGMPPVILAFVATNTACLPSAATPTPPASASAYATASTTAAPTAAATLTPVRTATPVAQTATPGGNSSHTTDENVWAGEKEVYPMWLLALVGAALVVGGCGAILGGAALVQRNCTPAAAAPAAAKFEGAATGLQMPHLNPLAAAASTYRGAGAGPGGRPPGPAPVPLGPGAAGGPLPPTPEVASDSD